MNLSSSAQKKIERILVAGIGNIFMGDDGFGVEVAQRLLSRKLGRYPAGVEIFDFGIRGFDLAYTLLEEYDILVLVDAIARGGAPGTVYLIEPDLSAISSENAVEAARVGMDAHSMDPMKVLAFARTLGARPIRTFLVGCEPSVIRRNDNYLDMQMGLSGPVQAAVDEAIKVLDSLVEQLLSDKANSHP
ncbi:MAG TPA: hydrogenase maturation protease [Ktedonobacteraceae bacterium]|nr:hydrogenase maturation protease [Ktedonobacteraceae bacterium]